MTRRQLESVGISSSGIALRLRAGRLHRVHRGVYRVGGPEPLPFSDELAAVLACGPGAVASHTTAAHIWGLPARSPDRRMQVSVPTGARSRTGIRVHRRHLGRADVTATRGVPVTTPARTIVDLGSVVDLQALERALAEAVFRDVVSRPGVQAALRRAPRAHGAAALRSLLASQNGPQATRSALERRMLSLLRQARLPEPACNVVVEDQRVDFLWREQRLVVETDGWRGHRSKQRFELDHRKEMALKAAGYEVLRFSYGQLRDDALPAVALIARHIGR